MSARTRLGLLIASGTVVAAVASNLIVWGIGALARRTGAAL